MGMIFCRGCAKEIHETALSCPQCGALQGVVQARHGSPGSPDSTSVEKLHWSSITALITGLLVTLLALAASDQWSHDDIATVVAFSCLPIVFAIASLSQKQPGRWMAITGLVLGCLMLLIALGNT